MNNDATNVRAVLADRLHQAVDSGKFSAYRDMASLLGEHGMKPALSSLTHYLQRIESPGLRQELIAATDFYRSRTKVVAIHQPDYFPWFGFFHKLYAADTFCLLDNVQWSKNSYYRRTYIRQGTRDRKYLIIPIRHCSDYELQPNIVVATPDWWKQHLNTLANTYRQAPYFKKNFPFVQELYDRIRKLESVNAINIEIILALRDWLGIATPVARASQLGVIAEKNQLNIYIVKALGGTSYYSGSAARNYNDHQLFAANRITIYYEDIFDLLEVTNPGADFVNGLSMLDWIFCYGKEVILEYLRRASDIVERYKCGCLPSFAG
jgi:WbqC-like protein family